MYIDVSPGNRYTVCQSTNTMSNANENHIIIKINFNSFLIILFCHILPEGVDMECVFNKVNNASLRVVTKFHHIDYERILEEDKGEKGWVLDLIFDEGLESLESLLSSHRPYNFPTRGCVQVFDELCEPTETLMYRFWRRHSSLRICDCDRSVLRLTYND